MAPLPPLSPGLSGLPLALLLLAGAAAPPPSAGGYYWPKRGGTHVGHGGVPYTVPTDFSRKPSWTWDNDDDELFRHGPVIDGKKNVYAVTAFGVIRKFSPDGALLWSWRATKEEGKIVTSPFLSDGKLFVTSRGHWEQAGAAMFIYAFDLETGRQLYKVDGPRVGWVNEDSSTIHAAEGLLLGAVKDAPDREGNNKIWAVNASDGRHLWDYVLEDGGLVWNFMPSTPGDGTFFFASCCGVAERRRLADGSRIWKSEVPEPRGLGGRVSGGVCSTGGGTYGPNGVFYVEANHPGPLPSLPGMALCIPTVCPDGFGILLAHRAEDGKVLWARRIARDLGGWQYPAVAELGGRLALVAGVGQNPALAIDGLGPAFLPLVVRAALFLLHRSAGFRRFAGVPVKRNGVAAYDAETGKQLWLWEEEPWPYLAAKGDEDRFLERSMKYADDPRRESICGPDNWGIPAVASGTVIIGSGSTGNLYAIRDRNGDGEIQEEEASTLETGQAFLNGPALAPGMLVAAPCWGKMYVFKTGEE